MSQELHWPLTNCCFINGQSEDGRKTERNGKKRDSATSAEDGLLSNGESMDELLGREPKWSAVRRLAPSARVLLPLPLTPYSLSHCWRRPTLNVMPLKRSSPFSFTFFCRPALGESFTGKILKLHFPAHCLSVSVEACAFLGTAILSWQARPRRRQTSGIESCPRAEDTLCLYSCPSTAIIELLLSSESTVEWMLFTHSFHF